MTRPTTAWLSDQERVLWCTLYAHYATRPGGPPEWSKTPDIARNMRERCAHAATEEVLALRELRSAIPVLEYIVEVPQT